jgi:hypothetical protein
MLLLKTGDVRPNRTHIEVQCIENVSMQLDIAIIHCVARCKSTERH